MGEPTEHEILQFVARGDVISPIWIKDIAELQPCKYGAHFDTWQIGTFPSRKFRIVGLVLHTVFYANENNCRYRYVVDDGTGCVEIEHTEYRQFNYMNKQDEPPLSPKAAGKRPQIDNRPEWSKPPFVPRFRETDMLPQWSIGCFTVRVRSQTRRVDLVSVASLRSVQEEVEHWKKVVRLHETVYSEPFVVPVFEAEPEPAEEEPASAVSTPVKGRRAKSVLPIPASPSLPTVSVLSPLKLHLSPSSRTLRHSHPADIKSTDLRVNTLALYLLFFMENAPPLSPSTLESPTDAHNPTPAPADSKSKSETKIGFSFEYLRRVPDLRYLARRIALANIRSEVKSYHNTRRSARANALERTDNRPSGHSPAKGKGKGKDEPPEQPTAESVTERMKALFKDAILHLYNQGDIVALEGSERPLLPWMVEPPRASVYPESLGAFMLWDEPPSVPRSASAVGDLTTTSTTIRPSSRSSRLPSSASISSSSRSRSSKDWRVGLQDHDGPIDFLSAPLPNALHEVFLPATPALLAPPVLGAVTALCKKVPRHQHGGGTPGDVRAKMEAMDAMWKMVNERKVLEALEYLEKEGRVWNYMEDRWSIPG